MGRDVRIDGQTHHIFTRGAPPPRGKGFSKLLRELLPGEACRLNTSIGSASTLANRAIGKGNYRSWTDGSGVIVQREIITRKDE